MNKRRLLRLALLLETLPRKRFDYGHWVGEDWKGDKSLSCGTTACALGWATTVPSFGLVLRLSGPDSGGYVSLRGSRLGSKGDEPEEAAMSVFGLTKEEVFYLFYPYYSGLRFNASPKRVAKHIRDFVKRGGLPPGHPAPRHPDAVPF